MSLARRLICVSFRFLVQCTRGNGIHTTLETSPNAMVKATLYTLRFDTRILERIEHFVCDFFAADVRVFLLVEMARESVEA